MSERVRPDVVSEVVRWGANANATTPEAEADTGASWTFHSNSVNIEAE
jgi:hypothetical protein